MDTNKTEQLGLIKCTYKITNTLEKTQLIISDFKDFNKLEIFIDNTIYNDKEYQFNETGIHNITFKIIFFAHLVWIFSLF